MVTKDPKRIQEIMNVRVLPTPNSPILLHINVTFEFRLLSLSEKLKRKGERKLCIGNFKNLKNDSSKHLLPIILQNNMIFQK